MENLFLTTLLISVVVGVLIIYHVNAGRLTRNAAGPRAREASPKLPKGGV